MLTFILTALSALCVGLYGAIQPGPLMALIISESIQKGWRSGMRVGMAPIITDPLILLAGVVCVTAVPNVFAAVISFIGAVVLFFFGYQSLRDLKKTDSPSFASPFPISSSPEKKQEKKKPRFAFMESSLAKGMAVNVVNPYLYIFAFTINAPIISGHIKGGHYAAALGYPLFFFAGIVSVNALIAFTAGIFKTHGSPRFLRFVTQFLGYILFLMGILALGRGFFFLLT